MDINRTERLSTTASEKFEYTLVNATESPETFKSITEEEFSVREDLEVRKVQHRSFPGCSPYPPISPVNPKMRNILFQPGSTLGLLPDSAANSKTSSNPPSRHLPWRPNTPIIVKTNTDNSQTSCQYGTFRCKKAPAAGKKKQLRVSFDLKLETDKGAVKQDGVSKSSRSRLIEKASRAELCDEESAEYLNSENDVARLLADDTALILTSPTPVQLRRERVTSLVCCPLCGLVANIYFLRSSYYARQCNHINSRRMLQHSDFCVRLAIIFGTLTWFLSLLLLVMYGMG